MSNNTQKSFLEFLHNKFNITVKGYGKDCLVVELNKIKNHKLFLVPYEQKETINYLNTTKEGEVFTTAINKYFVKNEVTGEKKIVNINKMDTLLTRLYKRDLIVLDSTNKYNEKFFKDLAPYELLDLPKRLSLFYRVDLNTIFNDLMEAGKNNEK